MQIATTAFVDQGTIAVKYTCDGSGYNPPITFSQVPKEAVSLVLFIEDPDAPGGTFTHWVLFNMPASTIQILENEVPPEAKEGLNSTGKIGYIPPCPPADIHRYIFTLYALDSMLDAPEGSSKAKLMELMNNHILEESQIVGLYGKK